MISQNNYKNSFLHYHLMILPMIITEIMKRPWYQDDLISMVLITLFCLWHGVISANHIKIILNHSPTISPISWISRHLCGELVLVGGATGRQRTWDWCPAEQRQTWSRAWTFCSGCCASSAQWQFCSHWKKSALSCCCCRQCSPCRHRANAQHQMTLVSQVPGWTQSWSWTRDSSWEMVRSWRRRVKAAPQATRALQVWRDWWLRGKASMYMCGGPIYRLLCTCTSLQKS